MRNRDIERQIRDAGEQAGERVRHYADGAASGAQNLFDRGRSMGERFGKRLTNAAEDFADEANYHYRRLRRQVNRHPTASVAIVAGTIGAFLLLRHVFRSRDDE
jgi:hypothetical protein